jgi:hypothetical protein
MRTFNISVTLGRFQLVYGLSSGLKVTLRPTVGGSRTKRARASKVAQGSSSTAGQPTLPGTVRGGALSSPATSE